MRRFVLVGAVVLAVTGLDLGGWRLTGTARAGGEIGFVEDFALAPDRTVPLGQLVPGTEDYYYYNALHLLNTEQFDRVGGLVTAWVQRHGETARVWQVRTRHAILTYDKNPQQSLEYLRNRMGLQFNHERELLGVDPNLPIALDPALITRDAYIARANFNQANLDQYEDTALDWLLDRDVSPNHRRSLLSRLARPDHAKLVAQIVADLNHENSGGFGSHAIHRQLLLPQLEALLKSKPELLTQQNYVVTYLTKLQPSDDVDWRHNPQEIEAYLDRLWAFAKRQTAAHNSLKSHILYHRLVLDRLRGEWNKERFIEYLKLPRPVGYLSKAMAEDRELFKFPADLNSNYEGALLLAPIGNDEPLVRSYLAHFLVDAKDAKDFEPYINDVYLRYLLAEVKIVNGLGEPEQWASLLPPELFQQLKERVDIDFVETNKTTFSSDEPVTLDLRIKNAGTLIVKVFEINTKNFYREQRREVDTDINLDGLVANVEQTHVYNDSPFRRMPKKFDFPQLTKPGVYIIDFIGNGRSSRALVRKGRLKHLVRTSAAGQVFTVLNDKNEQVKDATLWLSGHEYLADKDGTINVPFSTAPGRQPIVLSQGLLSSLDYFNHEPEAYGLAAGFYVDREALLKRKTAQVLIRGGLYLNGNHVALSLLEEVKLTITSTDLDGIASSQEIPDFKLFEDREAIHEFQVPARLSAISFTITAKVKSISAGGQKVAVAAGDSFSLNEINKTEKVEDLHLVHTAAGYIVELRGRTGEAKRSKPVQLAFKHRDFRDVLNVTLKTDPTGRMNLGPLPEITVMSVVGPEGTAHTWPLRSDAFTYAATLHGKTGEPIVAPYLPLSRQAADGVAGAIRSELSLLELRGETFVADRFENLSVKNGLVVLDKLPAGDYDLLLKSTGARMRVRVTAGEKLGRYIVGTARQLETRPLAPLQIASITVQEGGREVAKPDPAKPDAKPDAAKPDDKDTKHKLVVKLANATKYTRVHLFATRFVPEYDAFNSLSKVRDPGLYMFKQSAADSVYLTGRNIGDEYRYIIDRRYAKKYPGNSLERPMLLLNPWAVRATETGEQIAAGGDQFGSVDPKPKSMADRAEAPAAPPPVPTGNFADIDFLADASAVVVNLVPNENGVVEIDMAALGSHQDLHVVAVDPLNTVARSIALPEAKVGIIDLRLLLALDSQKHFTQQKQISVVAGGQPFVLGDITTSKFEAYDSLQRVYGLYATLNHDPNLIEFSFILNWPKLKPEEKRALYSKYASHELSFFLSRKDPEFYKSVIVPYLANKMDKTFMDHYLLGDELAVYLDPWNHEQLNVVEKILLAQRLKDERPHTSRHVGDQYALLPPNIDNFIRLFDTAVQRSALETGDQFGLTDMLKKTMKAESWEEKSADAPAAEFAPAPAAGAAPGGAPAPGLAAGRPGERAGGMKRDEAKGSGRELKEEAAKKMAPAKDGKARRAMSNRERDADAKAGEDKSKYAEEALFDNDGVEAGKRQEVRQLYRKLDKTMEWAENNYYHLTIDQQHGGLITVNAFWRDFANHDPAVPFQSKNLAEASRNFPEMLLALAVLDLPFEAPKHQTKFDGVKMTLTAGGPVVVFHEEIRPAAAPEAGSKVLVSQNFFRNGDRHRIEEGEQVDKFIDEEFLVHVVYGCQVVVTNPTSARQKLNVLLQIPQGAIPVLNSQATKTVHINLEPYHTQTLEYYFYFPSAGKYPQFPVHVAKNETLIAAAAPVVLNVVDKATKIDTGSWDYVSQHGSNEDVLTFLDKNNVNSLNLDRIAWRMKDAKMFASVIARLAQRHIYNHTLWSYAVQHNVTPALREFFQHADNIVNEIGGRIDGTLVTIDPVARRTYEYLEYKPLVNARAHALGKRRQIVNDRFHNQYHRLLQELCFQRQLTDDDLLVATYYLMLQDRIEEAIATFGKVNPAKVAMKTQYDYCSAYVKFFSDEPAQARAVATAYASHPVDRWRNTFAAIAAQLDEAEGKNVKPTDPEDRTQQQSQLAATEPTFDVAVEAKQIKIDYQNVETVKVNFYEMDVELLFSRNPFVQQFKGEFSSIRPNQSLVVTLPKDQKTHSLPLPKALATKNVLVEVVGAGVTKTQPYYAHSLAVQMIENYGQVKVTHQTTGKPVSKGYVKVYAQMANGQVKFYKDGYTDVRGRFDYASLNTNDLDVATKFSVLVLSDEFGAVVREATPPKR